jgi:predicted MPP superfamily phosphohydrolase
MQQGPLDKRRTFLKKAALGAVALGGAGEVYGRCIERHQLEVTTVPLALGLPQPTKVVVLGDLHYDPLHEEKYLREVIGVVNGLSPDLILYTGDFISQASECLPELTGILSAAQAVHGCYGVLGNHDSNGKSFVAVENALSGIGVHVLKNTSVPMPGQPGWYLSGLFSMLLGPPNPAVLANSPPDSRHILLAHEPDSFDIVTDPRIALQISGHTHGGQIRAPFIGALHLPKWGKNYQMGLYRKGERLLYVNRGVGTVELNVRVNCPPEVTLLELT